MTGLARNTRLDRRGFVKALGGGVLVLVSAPGLGGPAWELEAQRRPYPSDINAYLHIAQDGQVTLFSGKIEMGQGIMTSLAQMAAEELGVDLDVMHVVMGDTASCPWDAGTWGSMSTRFFGPAVRAAAAQARLVLTDLAAEHLAVPRAALVVEKGVVYAKADRSRHVSYGELAQGQQITRTVGEKAVLRSVREFSVMGRSPKRLDGRDKVTGAAKYAGDMRLPGMLYARILRPPAHGATPKSIDTTAAAAMAGVTVVNQNGLVAALAADPELAARALDAVKADWDVPASTVDGDGIHAYLVNQAGEPETPVSEGDLAAGRSASARTFDVEYRTAYVAHAPVEPHTSLADVKDGKATVWASTQSPFGNQPQVARALGFQPENVRIITPYVGGGFGGKSAGLQSVEAARLSQIVGKPVMVDWTRADEFFNDTFGPAAVIRIASGVDAGGRIVFWDYQVYAAGGRGADVLYDIPNRRVRVYGGRDREHYHFFGTGPWRAPGANSNKFGYEQQVDAMARAAGVDPLAFRLANTKDPRAVAVLHAVARASHWTPQAAIRRDGRGRGLALGADAGAYVAHVADVVVDRATGAVKVEKIWCAQDMGIVVNPRGAEIQAEGGITMGLGACFSEEIQFQGGKIATKNFDTYGFTRMSWVPEIEITLVQNDKLDPQGGGEPGIINMGAVIANAIYDATGARMTRLPMTPERVLAEIRKV